MLVSPLDTVVPGLPGLLRGWGRSVAALFLAGLDRFGVVDREKGAAALDLAAPVMVTGGLRILIRTADFLMVSLALGAAAVAGLQFGFQYYFIAAGLALALSSGTISVVSRLVGAGHIARADLAIKQSLWLALGVSVPLAVAGWTLSVPLIDLLTDDQRAIALGAVYLQVIAVSIPFRFASMVGSRALAGAGNTRTPMFVRVTTLPTNLVLNAVFIFGPGPVPALGIAGAALGTLVATALESGLFLAVLLSGRYAVGLRVGGPQFAPGIVREIARVSLPLSGLRIAQTFGRFPFLFVLGALGTNVVAAYAIARRLMQLAMMPAWGYSTASSTLVGQAIGEDDDAAAESYGWQVVRLGLVTQLLVAAVLVVAAGPLVRLFAAEHVALTVEFIHVFALMIAGFSVGRTLRGALRGAGDTTVPFYGTTVGNYLVRLPVAAAALPAGFAVQVLGFTLTPGLGLGLPAVYAAILGDIYARAGINWLRFRSNRWKAIARAGADRARAEAD